MSITSFLTFCLLWIIVLVLSVMVLKLYRIISAIQNKTVLAKSDAGFLTGTNYPFQKFRDINGKEINTIEKNKRGTVLLFTQYSCDICKRLYPIMQHVQDKYPNINFILLMSATKDEANQINEQFKLHNFSTVLVKDEHLDSLGISGFPFTYYLSSEGLILKKGIVNFKEHFDILLSNYKAS